MKSKVKSNPDNLNTSTSSSVKFQNVSAALQVMNDKPVENECFAALQLVFQAFGSISNILQVLGSRTDYCYRFVAESITEQMEDPNLSYTEKAQLRNELWKNADLWKKNLSYKDIVFAVAIHIGIVAMLCFIIRLFVRR